MSFVVLDIETPWRTMYSVKIHTSQTMRPVYRHIMADHQEPFEITYNNLVCGECMEIERLVRWVRSFQSTIGESVPMSAKYANKTFGKAQRLKEAIKERTDILQVLQEVVPVPKEVLKEVLKFVPYELDHRRGTSEVKDVFIDK